MGVNGQLQILANFTPRKELWFPLNMVLVGPQCQPICSVKELSPLPGFEPQIIQPIKKSNKMKMRIRVSVSCDVISNTVLNMDHYPIRTTLLH
jgi:hypothetical protein